MLDRRVFHVPVTCPACGHLLTFSYLTAVDDAEPTIFYWDCPHEGCQGRGTFLLRGEFLGTIAGPPRYFETPHATDA